MTKNSYLIIPYSIIVIKELKLSEKMVLAEIISLSKSFEKCFASNGFIAKHTGICERTVTNAIKELRRQGYLESDVHEDNSRTITLNTSKLKGMDILLPRTERISNPYDCFSEGIENHSNPIENSATYNNSYNNNYNNSYKRTHRAHRKNRDASYDIEELMKIK